MVKEIVIFDHNDCWFSEDVKDFAEKSGYEVKMIITTSEHMPSQNSKQNGIIYYNDESIKTLNRDRVSFVSSYQGILRKEICGKALDLGFKPATIIHPKADVCKKTEVGEGTVIAPNVSIGSRTKIGKYCIITRGVNIGHDVEIGDFVTISPGVNICSVTRIREECYIGAGATIFEARFIGPGTIIGGGSVVTKNIGAHIQAHGIPAKTVKENIKPR
jgi:sugar O-acyltransferase (sialic acid O-acetyltransferase NeuD family)